MLGRAMNDIENMRGTSQILSTDGFTNLQEVPLLSI